MLKTLLYINEDLASSIALRYTAYLNKFVPLSLYVTHVVEQTEKEQAGTGLVRRSWEDGVASSGEQLINRMLRTENIDCPLAGRPKVVMGNRLDETTYELRSGGYDLFIEGYLNTADPDKFYEVISSPLYTDVPCPTLLVKNLSISKKCALLCASSVDARLLAEKSMKILGDSTFKFDIVYYKYKDNEQLVTLEKSDGGSNLQELESQLDQAGKTVENISVLSGTPEQVGDYLKQYALVASTLPTRRSMRMQVLANSLAAVLLVR